MPLPDPANAQPTQSAQELLKGSYWEKFSGDGTLLHALHAYYAALTLRQKAPTNPNSRDPEIRAQRDQEDRFYFTSREALREEAKRVQTELPDEDKAYFDGGVGRHALTVPATGLFEIISKAAINNRATRVIFPDNKSEAMLFDDFCEREARQTAENICPIKRATARS